MQFTPKQQEVIDSRNESLLISAAAGSGKTSVLVARVIALLESGADLSRMLIVTFTNAAAAEMKERIADKLGPESVRHAHICTFHKFALDILKEYYQVIGLNPAINICDEYRQKIFKEDALKELFEELFDKDDEDFISFLNCYASSKSNAVVKDMILGLENFLSSLPNPDEFLEKLEKGSLLSKDAFEAYSIKIALASLETVIKELTFAKVFLDDPQVDGAYPMPLLSAKLADDIEKLMAISDSIEKYGIDSFSLLDDFKFTRMAKTKAESASFNFVEDSFKYFHENAKDEFKKLKEDFGKLSLSSIDDEIALMKEPLRVLARLTNLFVIKYQAKKKKNKVLDFSDIEHYALKILEDASVCEELKESFDYIFVDEYQDSNLVQDLLISKIAQEDNLFMVGDVKQSIYKFRLAEPELFLSKYELFKNGRVDKSRAIDLNSNFRSKLPVISFINKVFGRIMTKEDVGIEYDDDASLKEGTPYTGDLVYTPKLYLCETKASEDEVVDDEIEEFKAVELEALNAVKIIKEYHGKSIYDSKKGINRPLEYKDMVILLRSTKTNGEYYYNALEDAGIPVYLERGEGYFDTPEIQVMLSLLKVIDNFKQDIPLISVLHFPSFGFNAEELATIRIYSRDMGFGKISFADAFTMYANEAGTNLSLRCQEFIDKIKYYRLMEKSLPLSDFLWNVLCDSKLGNYAIALPSGNQRYANLKALVDKAASFEEQGGSGLFGFISYIETISSGDRAVETGQVTVLSEGSDTVRIMTIHKSKGLEFPFVLLAGLGSRFNRQQGGTRLGLHKDFGAAIRLVEPLKGIYTDPVCLKLIERKKKAEEFAETIRVLYVAMTRAKDILVMSAAIKDINEWLSKSRLNQNVSSCSNYLDMIGFDISLGDIKPVGLIELSASNDAADKEEILSKLDTGFGDVECELSDSDIAERLNFDYLPKEDELKKQKYSVSDIASILRPKETVNYSLEKDFASPLFIFGKQKLSSAAKGTAYHKVMEMFDFKSSDKSVKAISMYIDSLVERNLLSPDEKEIIEPDRISKFFESEIGKRASSAKELFKEKPFVLKTMFEGREVLVQGTIDCFFEEDGKLVLLDYKSNYIDSNALEAEKERLKAEYIPQLDLYKEALEKITGKKVKQAALYLFGINDTINLC